MNREIKFRAWDKTEQKMIRPSVEFQQLLRQVTNRHDNSIGGDAIRRHEIDWMQFTGLKDKNGIEIYEGDIVQKGHYRYGLDEHNRIWGPVAYSVDEDGCRYVISPYQVAQPHQWEDGRNSSWGMAHEIGNSLNGSSHLIEVIGNIHENPELLSK